MQDKLLVALAGTPFFIYGIVCIINPTFAFRFQFGGSRNRKKTPDNYEKRYCKFVGGVFIFIWLLWMLALLNGELT
jgi:hypothetical protein